MEDSLGTIVIQGGEVGQESSERELLRYGPIVSDNSYVGTSEDGVGELRVVAPDSLQGNIHDRAEELIVLKVRGGDHSHASAHQGAFL